MSKAVDLEFVVVEWETAQDPSSEWGFLDELDTGYSKCVTCGFLLSGPDDPAVILAATKTVDDTTPTQYQGVLTIPASAVLSISEFTAKRVDEESAGEEKTDERWRAINKLLEEVEAGVDACIQEEFIQAQIELNRAADLLDEASGVSR